MKQENLGIRGWINILHTRNGELIDERNINNLIVNAGKAAVAGLLADVGSVDPFSHIAIGTGTTAAAAGDTALETESHREEADTSRVTTSVTDDTAQLQATFNFTGTFSITESGCFNDDTSGTMLNRQVFSAIPVQNGDALQFTWSIQVQ